MVDDSRTCVVIKGWGTWGMGLATVVFNRTDVLNSLVDRLVSSVCNDLRFSLAFTVYRTTCDGTEGLRSIGSVWLVLVNWLGLERWTAAYLVLLRVFISYMWLAMGVVNDGTNAASRGTAPASLQVWAGVG